MDILSGFGIDPSKFALGVLCKRGHDFEGTGFSLRRINISGKQVGKPGSCVECQRMHKKELNNRIKAENQARLAEKVAEIERLERQLGINSEKYRLGSLCARNHDYMNSGRSLRLRSTNSCVKCVKLIADRFYQENKERVLANQSRDNGTEAPQEKYLLGSLCKKGHDFCGMGMSLRRAVKHGSRKGQPGPCVECNQMLCADYREQHREELKQYNVEYRQQNYDVLTARQREFYSANKDRINATRRELYRLNPHRHREEVKQYNLNNKDKARLRNKRYRESNRDLLRSLHQQWRLNNPEVVRAGRFRRRARLKSVHIAPYTIADKTVRLNIFDGMCAYCQAKEHEHWDHFIPISIGGPDAMDNLIPSCSTCNFAKHNTDPWIWYQRQPFFSKRRWNKILKVLGKTQETYNQLPLL